MLSWDSAKAAAAAAEAEVVDEVGGGGYGGREAGGNGEKSEETVWISGGGSLGHEERSDDVWVCWRRWGTRASEEDEAEVSEDSRRRFRFGFILSEAEREV